MFLSIELYFLINKLSKYEQGIIDIIKYFINIFISNQELKEAVHLWSNNKNKCIKKYGHISYWDVSKITDMSGLFNIVNTFNEDISRWDVPQVTRMDNMFEYTIFFIIMVSLLLYAVITVHLLYLVHL